MLPCCRLLLVSALLVLVSACTSTAVPMPSEAPTTAVLAQAPTQPPPTVVRTATPAATATRPPTATPLPTLTPSLTPTPVPTATATPQPTPYGGGRPVGLSIPSIGVEDGIVIDVGLDEAGAMETPEGWWDIGWYKFGPIPGEVGNSVLAGHYDSRVAPAVFWNLHRLRKGDKIIVKLSDGTQRTFVVETSEVYPYDRPPLDRIFGPTDRPRLNLVTCGGTFDANRSNYSNRLVVYAVAND
jgi:LPXTG-site transpeptidase (sortase) family protein